MREVGGEVMLKDNVSIIFLEASKYGGDMKKILEAISIGINADRGMASGSNTVSVIAKLIILCLSMSLALHAVAQPPSADAAIDSALQWLKLADSGQVEKMWEQSDPLMKKQLEQTAWVKYVGNMRSQLGPPPERRIWQSMWHQIDNPNLPRGEFTSVTFLSSYSNAPAWERVSLVWSNEHWTPVGYQSGLIAATAKQ
ncbi:DUF4019 domain-containing protein [Collimonas humicola]|uniref:DUF4019 domain-containing protein n=1 Tax=Collimonas humicola TaxID=2825886 RepID=UPI001B8BD6C6|nr:DUF4019 domain-containing protein [Collimonas humicola]